MSVYQVVAECAHVTVDGPTGRAVQLLMKGAHVPADAPELKRLLADKFVAEVSDDDTGGLDSYGRPAGAYAADVPENLTTTPVEKSEEQRQADADADAADKAKADAELADKRAAAQAKLPEDGSEPDGRASQAVWVEYLVKRGGNYDDLAKAEKADLQKLAKQQA
ncbi:hypothetical protein ACQP2Y_21610 [Actinoplanes sp. CA-051413]|uniref:hypothetical protein n=1 Tax=Actinoplanes sp. CA-051413 TaxID=3239899 RepID=UPI003D98C52F